MNFFKYLFTDFNSEIFFREYWGKNYIKIGNLEQRMNRIFNWSEFNRVLNTYPLSADQLQITSVNNHQTKTMLPELAGSWGKDTLSDVFSSRKHSLALMQVTDLHDGLKILNTDIKKYFLSESSGYCSYTPKEFSDTSYQVDTCHKMVVQIEGERLWILKTPKGEEEVGLRKGDFLFVPSNLKYKTIGKSEDSLHVAFRLSEYSYSDLWNKYADLYLDKSFLSRELEINRKERAFNESSISSQFKNYINSQIMMNGRDDSIKATMEKLTKTSTDRKKIKFPYK